MHEFVDALAVGIEHVDGADGFPPWRQFVNHADIEVAIERHSKGAWNGGGCHNEHVWGDGILHPKFCSLCHTETVLLVNHNKSQTVEEDIVFNDSMGAHEDVDVASHQSLKHLPAAFPLH